MPSSRVAFLTVVACAALTTALAAGMHAPADGSGAGGRDLRAVHLRVWDDAGGLLYSTWPAESGAYVHEDPEDIRGQPILWRHSSEALPDVPLWKPLLPMLDHAPPNATLRLLGHRFGDHKVGELVLPTRFELPRVATLSREAASSLLSNATAGQSVAYLGFLPVDVLGTEGDRVSFALNVTGPSTVEVERSVGLELTMAPAGDGSAIAFEVRAPSGSFMAHNNCALKDKLIEPGYYVLRSATEESLVFDRYQTRGEFLLQDRIVDLEIKFFDVVEDAPRTAKVETFRKE